MSNDTQIYLQQEVIRLQTENRALRDALQKLYDCPGNGFARGYANQVLSDSAKDTER